MNCILFKIITFNPEDFPDMTSGGLAEAYTSSGAEALLSVHPYSIYSTPEIRDYPLATVDIFFKLI